MRGPNRKKVSVERRLRRQSTDAETELWFALRDRRLGGFKFVRQEAIDPYVVDFVCRDRKVIVEMDILADGVECARARVVAVRAPATMRR